MRTALPAGIALTLTGLVAGAVYSSRPAGGASRGEPPPRRQAPGLPATNCSPTRTSSPRRAITVGAPPDAVWPWLVQMGSGRGGAYTYDWIENLFGLGMNSADEILPQFQQLAVDDVLPVGPNGPGMRVKILEPGRALVFRSVDGNWVWAFHLRPAAAGTRLISRNRIATPDVSWPMRVVNRVVMEPAASSWNVECCSASRTAPSGPTDLRRRYPSERGLPMASSLDRWAYAG